jgi:hypothetical protein
MTVQGKALIIAVHIKSNGRSSMEARGTEDGRWRSCRGAVEEQIS